MERRPIFWSRGWPDPEVASYLRFDVVAVVDARQQWHPGGPRPLCHGQDWTETDPTRTTRPATVGGVVDDTEKRASSTWVEYDVTPAVSGNGPLPLSWWPSLRRVPSSSPVMALSPRSWSSRSRT